jgi:hypothetical protein
VKSSFTPSISKRIQRADHRHTPDQLRDEPVFEQILGLGHGQQRGHIPLPLGGDRRAKAKHLLSYAAFDDLVETLEGPPADKQDVLGVDLDVLLLWVLPTSLRGNVGHRPLDDLEQSLLHALAGDISGNGGVLALPRDLVDLIDVDNAVLGIDQIEVGRLQQPHQDVLDIFSDVARLGETGGVDDGKRNL